MASERLIDHERYKTTLQRFEEHLTNAGKLEAAEAVRSLIKGLKIAPTVDAVEVVHGRWTSTTEPDEQFGEMDYFKCSVCGKLRWFETNYCPNCGADMRGVSDA